MISPAFHQQRCQSINNHPSQTASLFLHNHALFMHEDERPSHRFYAISAGWNAKRGA
ncbi:hypothetical protein FHU10_1180 [Serratia fonticola]|uniref:Uncharacterized protein n=1 Tax=Serratia fonticola TaxID=47917 RepID=A0A542D7Z1_SERFO|nr:hypothetical protein FHU09_1271 [Serratia fonticola]TQI99201.1 hypothetical protein FHU11_4781 [Serratia fonticola]TVZ68726.1 hypothetical protein FHU10_1180 [Serratia fonticola]